MILYLTIDKLLPGMIIARTIFNSHGMVILLEGEVLTEWRIEKIKNLRISGAYVQKPESKSKESSPDVISTDIRRQALTQVRTAFDEVSKQGQFGKDKVNEIIGTVNEVLDQLLSNPGLVMNINDIKIFDEYVYFHSVNVMIISLILGIGLKLDKNELSKLGLSAILHDIGKTLIPDEILNKPGKLTDEEFAVIKKHSFLGYEILKAHSNIPKEVTEGVLDHHERYDGYGYAYRKKGTQISLFGRIITVADVYDALTSERVYRAPMLPADAINYVILNSGIMFDPEIVKVFRKYIIPYPIGTMVKLSNSYTGIILENNLNNPCRPVIKILYDNMGIYKDYRVDLANDEDYVSVHITQVLKAKKKKRGE